MDRSYFAGTWLSTSAHPSVKIVLEVCFHDDGQFLVYLGNQIHPGNWKFDQDTKLITLFAAGLNVPNSTFKVENERSNSFDLVGPVVKDTVYFVRK